MDNSGFPIAAFEHEHEHEHEHEFPAITKSKNFDKPIAENSHVSVVSPATSILRGAPILAHLDDHRIELTDDLDQIGLSRHHRVDVFISSRSFVGPR